MVQPKYNPQEALERVKLLMKYDNTKTLTENIDSNKLSINEQSDNSKFDTIQKIAEVIYTENNKTLRNSDEQKIVDAFKAIDSRAKLLELIDEYKKTYNKDLGKHLIESLQPSSYRDAKEIQEIAYHLSQYGVIFYYDKANLTFVFDTSGVGGGGGKNEGGKNEGGKNGGGKNGGTDEQGVYTTPGDPYQYKVIGCVWHTKGGPKNIQKWKSLAGNENASKILDGRYPKAKKGCSPTPTPQPVITPVVEPDLGNDNTEYDPLDLENI